MKWKSWSVRAFALAALWVHAGLHSAAARPNVILILADDLGYGDLSCYGGWIETPGIDALAQEGLRFTDFHSNGAVCSPTRAALLTGRYQQRAGLGAVVYADGRREQHYHGLQTEERTIAEAFRDAGYQTGMYGKWHLGYYPKYNPTRQGFQEFHGYVSGNIDFFSHIDQSGHYDWWDGDQQVEEPGYVTHLINRHAVDFIDRHRQEPFFLYLAHEAPHYPYQGPNDPPERALRGDNVVNHTSREAKKNAYREMVQAMDDGIVDIRTKLDEWGLADNTLIFFLSDNGATSLGSNGALKGTKGSVWEGGHRVPAIAWWPGRIAPGVSDQLGIGMDLAPTLATIAELGSNAFDRPLDGIDLSDHWLGGATTTDARRLVWEHGANLAVRQGPWKWVRAGNSAPQLYRLDLDPGETKDLADAYPTRLEGMRGESESWGRDVATDAAQQPEGRPGHRMPRVLIIGDSISLGYTPLVRERLEGIAEVAHNPGNAQHTGTGLERIDEWIGDQPWDVIHFNWGLWDLCYRHPEATTAGKRDKIQGQITFTPKQYRENLDRLAQRLLWTRADLIWGSTTPVPENEPGRFAGAAKIYNQVAADVMSEHGIPTNDLWNHVIADFAELAVRPGDVHFTREGSESLADAVATRIEETLRHRGVLPNAR